MIELADIAFEYARGRTALSGVSAVLDRRVTAVLGPNGAGKSTLLKILSLQLGPGRGGFTVSGHDLRSQRGRDDYRRQLGVMPQHLDLLGGYTCAEFLRYAAWMREVPRAEVEHRVSEALQLVGLVGQARHKVSTLSGGMRQRLGLAQALVNVPRLLVLDEPTVGLDPRQRAEFRNRLSGLDCQMLLATHLVEDVAALADAVLLIGAGRVLFHGDLAEFCGSEDPSSKDVEQAYLRFVPSEAAAV